MRRGRPDEAPPASTRDDRATDAEAADRSGAAPVARDGRPAGRADTRASDDDALVSFPRPVSEGPAGSARRRGATAAPSVAASPAASPTASAGSFDPTESFDPDESFDAHDAARGIRARAVRATAAPVRGGGLADRAVPGARPSDGRTHFESAGGDQYSRTSEHGRRRGSGRGGNGRRAPGPFDERESSSDTSRSEPAASPGETRRAAPARPARSLKGRALGYLSRREYSRSELARKLAPYVEDGDEPEALLDSLEREGWLSDARFTESLVHRRAARVGTARILGELKRHAVDGALVESVGEQLRETEFGRAQAVWRKKFGSLPVTPAERARQARFLAARGFSSAIIVKLLKVGDDEFGDF